MTSVLTDNLPLLAGAPNGIRKLRELILELAVRGKLVPQEAGDEWTAEALSRLHRDASCRTNGGSVDRSKDSTRTSDTPNYSLPESWAWVRLGEIVEVLDHLRKPVTKQDRLPGSIPYYGASGVVDYVSAHLFDEPLVLVGEDGAKWGRGDGTAFSVSGKTWVNNHAHVLRPLRSIVIDDYIVYVLVGADLGSFITGMTVPKLNQTKLVSIPVPLPPLAEQHRIVAKVDELMALCDTLEAQQADAESAHARLVQALLDSLTQASEAQDFATHWQRLSAHFDTLFTTESSIDALKQTLLQLAVMGKLVPQDPSDEPATYLLDRVAAMKNKLAGSRKHAKKDDMPNRAGRYSLPMPSGWAQATIGDVTICRDGERIPVPRSDRESKEKLFDYYGASGVIDKIDGYIFDKPLLLVGEDGANLINRSTPIAFIARGRYWVNNHAHVLDGLSENVLKYFELYFNAIDLKPYVTGTAQPKMNQAKMNGIVIPLPPEREQNRIVAKVDELMALCYQLKTRLRQARDLNQQLATTLVERAVA